MRDVRVILNHRNEWTEIGLFTQMHPSQQLRLPTPSRRWDVPARTILGAG